MDVNLLQKCQLEGPSGATFEKFVDQFRTAFSDVDGASAADRVKLVEERLLFLMEKLEAMQDGETSDSTEEEEEEEEEEGDAEEEV